MDGSEDEAGERRGPRREWFRARVCTRCGLRFPVDCDAAGESRLGETCPQCGAATTLTDPPYTTAAAPREREIPTRCELAALLDNLRSLRNVGSIVRTADGVGLAHLVLAGVTPTPDHPGLAKTALGAERSIAWSHRPDAVRAAAELVTEGWSLWALEGGTHAQSLFDPEVGHACAGARIALVLGHEVSGLDVRILEMCERVVFIPMLGIKGSLNVSVAFGIAAYVLRFGNA